MAVLYKFSPIEKKLYHGACTCYDGATYPKKAVKICIDTEHNLVYCEHCGNQLDPFRALVILNQNWESIKRSEERVREIIKKHWEVGQKYRPWKRSVKELERRIGQKGQNLPVCPHCNEPFRIEEIKEYVDEKAYVERGVRHYTF